ncbi:MAG: THUMP domain-containing protein [Thermoplasmatota archaeon]
MTLVLIRFAELGLKSQRVRSRFLRMFAQDIEESMISNGVEHIMEVERSRIFIEVEDFDGAARVLRQVPGVHSFSLVMPAASDKASLMFSLSEYGAGTIREGMSYGLKVRRTGETGYTSQEIAVEGGGAVVSHLPEGSAHVDLKAPDIWIEVEIRGRKAYIFHERFRGMGGMPASSQGRVILYMPPLPEEGDARDELVKRAFLSHELMRRRGCRVIPVAREEDVLTWRTELRRSHLTMDIDPIPGFDEIGKMLVDASLGNYARGVLCPFGLEGIEGFPVLHSAGEPLPMFYPTVSMNGSDLDGWLKERFI